MMKFFRKYTKHLLAVFMALLLVVWLAGDALSSLLSQQGARLDQPRAKVYGEVVLQEDVLPAYLQLETLQRMLATASFPWATNMVEMGMPSDQVPNYLPRVRGTPLDKDEWYMLDAAARRQGIEVPMAEVQTFKERAQLSPQLIARVRETHHRTAAQIDEALRSYLRILRTAGAAAGGVSVSDAEIQRIAEQILEKHRFDFVIVPAQKFIDESYQPTDEELKAQFEKHKSAASQPSLGIEGFGYEVPQAAQTEFIRIDLAQVARTQQVGDDEAMTYWEAHPSEFLQPATQPATPGQPPARLPYGTFTAAKPSVVERLQREKAKSEVRRIAYELVGELSSQYRQLTATQPAGSAPADAAATLASAELYTGLIDRLQERYGNALTYGRTDLLTQEGLQRAAEFPLRYSFTSISSGGQPQQIRMPEAAYLVEGLAEPPADDAPQAKLYRKLYETTALPFFDYEGNGFVFRTVAVRKAMPPESTEPVREQLVKDVRLIKAHEAAKAAADALAEVARSGGTLADGFANDAALVEKLGKKALKRPEPFALKSYMGFGVMTEGFIPVPELSSYGPGGLMPKLQEMAARVSTTQPAPVETLEQRDHSQWVVAQYIEPVPITTDEYKEMEQALRRYLRMERQIEVLKAWYDPEQIRARVGWEPIGEPQAPTDQASSNGSSGNAS